MSTSTSTPIFRRRLGGAITAVAATAALLLGAVVTAQPAAANVTWLSTSTPTGVVGVPVTLIANSNSTMLGASVTFQANGNLVGTAPIINGVAQMQWTPASLGSWNISAWDGFTSMAVPFSVAATATSTSVAAANFAQVGVPTIVSATVTSLSPSSFAPAGTVSFFTTGGSLLSTVVLVPSTNPGQSFANLQWTPMSPVSTGFYGVFNPAGTPANALTSTSQIDTITVTNTPTSMAVVAPATVTIGVPTPVSASLAVATPGVVTFTANGALVASTVPVNATGVATFTWVPQAAGATTLQAFYTPSIAGVASQTATDSVNVVSTVQVDSVTVTVNGGSPWNNAAPPSLRNGQTITVTARAASGSPVTLGIAGNCSLSGSRVTGKFGAGTCVLDTATGGGNGFSGVNQQFVINLIPGTQSARIAAPNSGTLNVGKTFIITNPGTRTNAGNTIYWKVTKGSSVCKLSFPSNGSVKMKAAKKGSCTLTGTAPSIPNQWNAYKVTRNYKVR